MSAATRHAARLARAAVLAAATAAILGTTCDVTQKPATTISAPDLLRQIETGTAPLIFDLRTPAEFAAGHVPGARNIPHDELASRIDEVLAINALGARTGALHVLTGHLVLYCHAGQHTPLATIVLERAGFGGILSLEGQWTGWLAQGLPVEKEDESSR